MARQKKPSAKDWRSRAIEDWNTTTVHAYLMETHQERFGVPYYPFGSWIMEKKMIKTNLDEHGAAAVKEFIDKCLDGYTPNDQYPGISFGFMFKYQNRFLQQIIKKAHDRKRQEAMDALFKETETGGDDLDWI